MASSSIGFILFGVVVVCILGWIGILYARNRGKVSRPGGGGAGTSSNANVAIFSRCLGQRAASLDIAVVFFCKHLLLELISLVFTVLEAVDVEAMTPECTCIEPLRIAFYVCSSAKYAIVALSLYIDHARRGENVRISVVRAGKGYIPAGWVESLSSLVFLGAVVVDGILLNLEWSLTGQSFDLIPFDSVILIALDTALLIKLTASIATDVHSEGDRAYYYIQGILWQMSLVAYDLAIAFVFVYMWLVQISVPHRRACEASGGVDCISDITLTAELKLLLSTLLLHTTTASYTSLMAQQITARDRALKSAPNLRVRSLTTYLWWFAANPWAQLLNVLLYVYAYFVYISLFTLTSGWVAEGTSLGSSAAGSVLDEEALRAGLSLVIIIAYALNGFFLLNLIFGTLKRLGPFFNLRAPFDCTTYAERVNAILGQCNANFRMNTHMQTA